MNIDLSQYTLATPTSIKKIKKPKIMYDITVEDDHTFYIFLNDNNMLLTHNCDGQHIASLIINFFQKWFPHIIEGKHLFKLMSPLVVCTVNKERKYFYTLSEYEEYSEKNNVTNVNYLKGLGSLSIEDWVYVMNNKVLFQLVSDRSAEKYLDVAFGPSSQKRKNWLEGV